MEISSAACSKQLPSSNIRSQWVGIVLIGLLRQLEQRRDDLRLLTIVLVHVLMIAITSKLVAVMVDMHWLTSHLLI